VEELLEGVSIPVDVRNEQLRIRPLDTGDFPAAPHKRTLINAGHPSPHLLSRRPSASAHHPAELREYVAEPAVAAWGQLVRRRV